MSCYWCRRKIDSLTTSAEKHHWTSTKARLFRAKLNITTNHGTSPTITPRIVLTFFKFSSSLVADFRRWMKASPTTSPLSPRRSANWKHTISYPQIDPNMITAEKLTSDPTSIEGVVERLLDPGISEEEVTDYQKYVYPIHISRNLQKLTSL